MISYKNVGILVKVVAFQKLDEYTKTCKEYSSLNFLKYISHLKIIIFQNIIPKTILARFLSIIFLSIIEEIKVALTYNFSNII